MSRSKRVPYVATGPFVVRRRVRYSGQWLIPGEAFNHEECGERRTRQMWEGRLIDVGEPEVKREPRIHSHDRDIEKRLAEMVDWRSMGRVELIAYVEKTHGVKCTSKKNATEFMEEWEANQ